MYGKLWIFIGFEIIIRNCTLQSKRDHSLSHVLADLYFASGDKLTTEYEDERKKFHLLQMGNDWDYNEKNRHFLLYSHFFELFESRCFIFKTYKAQDWNFLLQNPSLIKLCENDGENWGVLLPLSSTISLSLIQVPSGLHPQTYKKYI